MDVIYHDFRSDPAAVAASTAAGDRPLALVVDDVALIRIPTRKQLEKIGFSVLEAGDGSEALQTYRRHADAIELVVTDLQMPHMTGLDLITALRTARTTAALVVMTGKLDGHATAALRELQVDFVLLKPFTAEQLKIAIEAVRSPILRANRARRVNQP